VIQISSSKAGFVLITATVGGNSIVNGSPARVLFAPVNIYVPRVFTPNGDGTNDILKPILVGITSFHYFSVYNRWGNLLFTTENAANGWDGTFKGVPQPVETYLWIAEGVNNQGKTIVQKGMVSLVR
jgi:gliding motility-associated-like protein